MDLTQLKIGQLVTILDEARCAFTGIEPPEHALEWSQSARDESGVLLVLRAVLSRAELGELHDAIKARHRRRIDDTGCHHDLPLPDWAGVTAEDLTAKQDRIALRARHARAIYNQDRIALRARHARAIYNDEVWVDAQGGEHIIVDMEQSHRRNVQAMLRRGRRNLANREASACFSYAATAGGDMASLAAEQEADRMMEMAVGGEGLDEWFESLPLITRLVELDGKVGVQVADDTF